MAYSPSIVLGPGALAGVADASTSRAKATARAAATADLRRALLIGTADPHVCSLLTDVLRDIQLDVRLDRALATDGDDPGAPDVLLAMVDRADGVRAITAARARFPKVPVVAILHLGTHRLGTRAVAAGAAACYVLDQPIDRLRGLLTALLAAAA